MWRVNTMKMTEHNIDLQGPGCFGKYARPEAIGAVLARVKPTILETVRMGFLQSSRPIGRPLKELRAVSDIRYGGQSKGPHGSTRLHFRAPAFSQAAPRLFEQGLLFDDNMNASDTAFDLVGDLLLDVRAKEKESERFDSDLLKRVADFDFALRKGIEVIEFGGHRLDDAKEKPFVNNAVTAAARIMFEETPRPKRVRITGKFDMIRASDRVFELLLRDGRKVRAVWAEPNVVPLKDFLTQDVVIEGQAIFRPSGSLLRIDTSAITAAKQTDYLFSELPQPASRRLETRGLTKSQTSTTGINAIWGIWPGDETEEELIASVRKVR
jgi:hypothetical protein